MKKILIAVAAFILIFSLVFVVAKLNPSAENCMNEKGASCLFLFEKENFTDCNNDGVLEGDDCGDIKENGAWVRMNLKEITFMLNGHSLQPNTNYTLIYYGHLGEIDKNNVWPYATCIKSETSSKQGLLKMNGYLPRFYENINEKLWLVKSSDVSCTGGEMLPGEMTSWNPEYYLFGYNTI